MTKNEPQWNILAGDYWCFWSKTCHAAHYFGPRIPRSSGELNFFDLVKWWFSKMIKAGKPRLSKLVGEVYTSPTSWLMKMGLDWRYGMGRKPSSMLQGDQRHVFWYFSPMFGPCATPPHPLSDPQWVQIQPKSQIWGKSQCWGDFSNKINLSRSSEGVGRQVTPPETCKIYSGIDLAMFQSG